MDLLIIFWTPQDLPHKSNTISGVVLGGHTTVLSYPLQLDCTLTNSFIQAIFFNLALPYDAKSQLLSLTPFNNCFSPSTETTYSPMHYPIFLRLQTSVFHHNFLMTSKSVPPEKLIYCLLHCPKQVIALDASGHRFCLLALGK